MYDWVVCCVEEVDRVDWDYVDWLELGETRVWEVGMESCDCAWGRVCFYHSY